MTIQETTNSTPANIAALAATFKMRTKTSYHIRDSDFQNGTAAVYGKRIEILESANDSTHEFTGVDGAEPDKWDKDKLREAIADGAIEAHRMNLVLNDLVKRGVLPAGDYFIRVSW